MHNAHKHRVGSNLISDVGEFHRAVEEAMGLLNREFPRWRKNPYLWKNGGKGLYLRIFSPALAALMRKGMKK